MKYFLKSKKGFSLIELLVTIAILSIAMTAITGILTFGYNMYNNANLLHDAHALATLTEQKIEAEVLYAGTLHIDTTYNASLASSISTLYFSSGRLAKDTGTAAGTNTHNYAYQAGAYTELNCAAVFSSASPGTLRVNLTVTKGTSTLYQIQTDIQLVNMSGQSLTGSGPAVEFSILNIS